MKLLGLGFAVFATGLGVATASRADLVPVRVVEGSLRGCYVAVSMALGCAFLALMPLVMIMFLCTALL